MILCGPNTPVSAQSGITVLNPSFETPNVSSQGYVNQPTNAGWTIYGDAGIALGNYFNGPGQAPDQNAPDGTQVGYLQSYLNQTYTYISQTVSGLQVGQSYYVIVSAAPDRYATPPGTLLPINVIFGSQTYQFTPVSGRYQDFALGPFSASTASQTLTFASQLLGSNVVATAMIDNVRIIAAGSIPVSNFSFETPSVPANSGYLQPGTAGWTFTGASGIGLPGYFNYQQTAPDGSQVGWVQSYFGNVGSISQALSNLQAGQNYSVIVSAAQRESNVNGVPQPVSLTFGAQSAIQFTPAGTSYQDYTFGPFTADAASQTLSFASVQTNQTDTLAMLDNMRVVFLPPYVSSVTLSPNAVTAGASSAGTVTLSSDAPPSGVLVSLQSDNPAATVPASVTVPGGQVSAAFTVTTTDVPAATTATISATAGGVTQTAALTITPASPSVSDLSAYATGDGKITLYWTPVVNATGYNLYRGTTSGGEDYAHPVNGSTPVNTPSYSGSPMDMDSDTGLTNGVPYFYTVKAVYASGESQASNEDSDTPDAAAVPWDTRNPGAILSAFSNAFASDTSGIGADPFSLRVVGPDNTVYDDSFSTPQPPDGSVAPGTNQLVRPDGSTQALPDDEGELDPPMQPAPGIHSNAVGTQLRGDKGPFRRVSTRRSADGSGDYRGATGTFYLPTATVSKVAVDNFGDSPVIYLGISGSSIEVDAGLAYQNGTHSWALEMQVGGKLVSSQGQPGQTIIPTPLENAPSQYQRFAPNSSVIMSYWAWGRYPTTGRAKLSLLLVDDPYTDPENPIAAALGAPARYLNREENVRVKRVHAIAQKVVGVSKSGSTVDGASWSQGSVFLPDAAGSSQGWSRADGTLPGEDGYYDGGNASVMAFETSPYIQEDNINIDISP